MTFNQFIKECHKREVFKMLSIYVVSSWVILQVLSVTWQPLGLPEKSVTVLIMLLLVGFPIYIFYIWRSRLKYTVSTDLEDAVEVKNRKVFEHFFFSGFGVIAFFCALAVLLIVNTNFVESGTIPEFESSGKIAVLAFDNNTGDEKFDVVGKMSLDWIQHGITEYKVGQVITQDIVNDYSNAIKTQNKGLTDKDILSDYLKPSKIIDGSFFLKDDKLLFRASIIDAINNVTLFSFKPVECDSSSPFDCIEVLQQRILGYLITEDPEGLNLDQSPPKYEAYQYWVEAQENFDDKPDYLKLLNKAIAADSTYFEAKAAKVLYYYNQREFKTFDSLRLAILPRTGISKRQRNLIDHYDALLKGDNKRAYTTVLNEYNIKPFHPRTNQTAMVIAHQFVNKPEMVETFWKEIPMDDWDLNTNLFGVFRIYMKAYADMVLKKDEETVQFLEQSIKRSNHYLLKKALISAYVRTNKLKALDSLINKIKLVHKKEDWEESNIFAGKEILVRMDSIQLANNYFDEVINSGLGPNNENFVNAHYYKGDFEKAEALLADLHNNEPENINHLAKLAATYFHNNKTKEAEDAIGKLNTLRTEYDLGKVDYAIAQVYASQNENDIAISHLNMSVAAGNRFSPELYQNDYHFKSIINTPEFNLIMNFWH